MPVKQFFSVLEAGRKLDNQKRWISLIEQCDVAAIPMCTVEYSDDVKKFYLAKITDGEFKKHAAPVFKADDKQAAKLIQNIFDQKAKLEGLN